MGLDPKFGCSAKPSGGKVATITLEMLAKAREIADRVEVVYRRR